VLVNDNFLEQTENHKEYSFQHDSDRHKWFCLAHYESALPKLGQDIVILLLFVCIMKNNN